MKKSLSFITGAILLFGSCPQVRAYSIAIHRDQVIQSNNCTVISGQPVDCSFMFKETDYGSWYTYTYGNQQAGHDHAIYRPGMAGGWRFGSYTAFSQADNSDGTKTQTFTFESVPAYFNGSLAGHFTGTLTVRMLRSYYGTWNVPLGQTGTVLDGAVQ